MEYPEKNKFGIIGELKPTTYLFICPCSPPYIRQTICKYAALYVRLMLPDLVQISDNIWGTCNAEDFEKIVNYIEEYYNLTEGQCRPV